jgi:hypothetical protein
MEGVKMWLSSWVADTGVQNVIPQYDNSSVLPVTKLRSSEVICATLLVKCLVRVQVKHFARVLVK